jgi:hypothetical protein
LLPGSGAGATLRSVYADVGAADPAGPLEKQECDDIGDLLGRTKTAERKVSLDEPLEALGIPLTK